MSGHSRWSQIKHKKALSDRKRGQIFSKLSRLITLAAKKGIDPKMNPGLAQAMERARSENMPNENIERAIKKVSNKDQDQLSEFLVEAIGPGGIALQIKGITDNKNRTIAEIKNILGKNESKMVPPGGTTWMFQSTNPAPLQDQTVNNKFNKLLEALDDHDDVEEVISNTE